MARPPVVTRPFLACFAANLAQGLAFNLFLHLPGFLQELGAGEVQIGFLWGLTGATAVACRPEVGRQMDLRGRRRVILAGALLNILVCALYLGIAEIGIALVAVRVLHGASQSVLFSGLMTYAADVVPAGRRTEGLAVFGVSGILPLALGSLLGDALLLAFDYGALFVAATGFAALCLLLVLWLPERRPEGGHEERRGFAASLSQPDLVPIWFVGTLFATALAAAFAFVKTFTVETGVGSLGRFFAAYAGAAILLRVTLAWLPERVGPKRVLLPAMVTFAAGFVLLSRAESALDLGAAGACCGLGHGFTFPILTGLVVTRARAAERGAAIAIFTALFDAGSLIGGPAFGAVLARFGYAAMFQSAAGVIAVGLVVFTAWDRRAPGDRPRRLPRARGLG